MRMIWKEKGKAGVLGPTSLQRYNRLFSLFAAFYYLIYLLYIIEYDYTGSIYQRDLFRFVIVLMVISYYVVYGFRGGLEIHLLTAYCLWAAVTRVAHGELLQNWEFLVELMLMIVLFAPGIMLQGEKRDRYYRCLAWFTVIFLSLLGLVCIYTAATRGWIINPRTGDGIGYPSPTTWRIKFLRQHWNKTAGLYLISFCLSLTLFPRSKKALTKAAAILTAIIAFFTIALTISRNAQTCAGAALGLLVGISVVNHYGIEWKKLRKVTVLIVISVVVLLGAYRLYEPIRKGLWQIHDGIKAADAANEDQVKKTARKNRSFELVFLSEEVAEPEEEIESYVEDTRDYLDSGRKEIYWSALKSLQMDPRRLLIGSKIDEVMAISHSLIEEQAPNFHNCFLQVVNEFGLPALVIVVAFFLMMLRNSIAVAFQGEQSFTLQDQVLILPVIALMGYNLLEAKSFVETLFLSSFFFFACGMLTGVYHEKTGKE